MKKPFTIIKLIVLPLALLVTGLFIYHKTHPYWLNDAFEENEENESPAEVFGSFDMWSDMRSYPDYSLLQKASYRNAFEYSKKLPTRPGVNGLSQDLRVEGQAAWTPLAPKNFSGRILSLAFHPTNSNIMFAGSASGGLWKTTNGGTGDPSGINWTQVATGFPVLGVPAIAINPLNANEMYIGTGEVYNTGGNGFAGENIRAFRGSYGVGILKSTDGGGSWTSSKAFTNSSIKGVQEIIIDPVTPANVFAATSDGVYRSTNSGGSWTLIHSVIMAMDICIEPGNANVLYVADGDFGSAGSGVYKCTNALAATPSFTQLAGGFPTSLNGRIALSICPNNANLIFASVGKIPGSSGGTAGTTYGLFKSTNGGTNWAATTQPQLSGSNYIQNQGWYSHDVIVAPTTVNTVYVAEIDMLRSLDGGATFTQKTDWSKWNFSNTTVGATAEGTSTGGTGSATGYVHADQHHLYFSPFDATYNTIFIVCDGGVFRSTDGGNNFVGLNGGLMTTQIYHNMSTSATNNSYMLCGLQDNATLWYQGSAGCKRTTGGDGFYTVIDPTNDQICFGTYSYMTLYRSTTGPAALGGTPIFNNPANATASLPTENACFVAPVVMAPSDHTRMYGGTINFKKSTTNGASFANVGATPVVNASAPIICIGVSSTYADSVYIATCPGGAANPQIMLSTNGGTTFVNRTGTLPNRYFACVEVDPTNSKRVAVAVSGFGTGHVFITSDAGVTWNDISGTGGTALPDVPANVVMFDPSAPSTVYVGNDLGLYVAGGVTNGSTQPVWYSYNTGLTDATIIMDILVAPNGKLRLGTYGKGLWENVKFNFLLPVVFKNIDAYAAGNGNQVSWTISSQSNVNHYEVEYSTDGSRFDKLANVNPVNTSQEQSYTYLHSIQNLTDGYYRIKVVDQDGAVQYSDIKKVKASKQVTELTAYPNPTAGLFNLQLPTGTQGPLSLRVYDNAGKMIMQKKLTIQAGTRELPVDISNMAAGYYRVSCENNNKINTVSVLRKK
jgi:hypothetical protein